MIFEIKLGMVSSISCTRDGGWVFTLGEGGEIRQWSTKDYMVISHWGNLHPDAKLQGLNVA